MNANLPAETAPNAEPARRSLEPAQRAALRPENQRLLALLDEWESNPLTKEEDTILTDMETFRREHPVSFNSLSQK